eukprot:scaffold34550_cov56-Attheya_sp.AAC.3
MGATYSRAAFFPYCVGVILIYRKACRETVESLQNQCGPLGAAPFLRSRTISCLTEVRLFLSSVTCDRTNLRPWTHNSNDDNDDNSNDEDAPQSLLSTAAHELWELAKIIVQPLLLVRKDETTRSTEPATTKNRDNSHWLLALEVLLPSCIYASNVLVEGNGLRLAIVDLLFGSLTVAVRTDRILPLLTISVELRPFLEPHHWIQLRRLASQSIPTTTTTTMTSVSYMEEDAPGMVRILLELFVLSSPGSSERDNCIISWEELLLRVYQASASSHVCSTVESVLQTSLSNASPRTIHRLVHAIQGVLLTTTTTNRTLSITTPMMSMETWAATNVLLLILKAQQAGPQLIYGLTTRALEEKQHNKLDLMGTCCHALVQILLPVCPISVPPKRPSQRPTGRRQTPAIGWKESLSFLQHTVYSQRSSQGGGGGGGVWSRWNKQTRDMECLSELSDCSKSIYSSIFLRNASSNEEQRIMTSEHDTDTVVVASASTSERAQMWVHAAHQLIRTSSTSMTTITPRHYMMAMTALTVVFCHVPSSRATLVRDLSKHLTGTHHTNQLRAKQFYCTWVANLVRTHHVMNHPEQHDFNDVLAPVAELLSTSQAVTTSDNHNSGTLSPKIATRLVEALAPLPCARPSILSMAHKYMDSPFGIGNIWWMQDTTNNRESSGPGGGVHYTRLYRALHGLCSLIRTTHAPNNHDDDDDDDDDRAAVAMMDECGMEALVIVSDIIVLNKPALPLPVRTWLYQTIMTLVIDGSISDWVRERLLACAVMRFLTYFQGIHNAPGSSPDPSRPLDQSVVFSPKMAFVQWNIGTKPSSNSPGPRKSMAPRDNLTSIMRLIGLLLRKSSISVNDTRSVSVMDHLRTAFDEGSVEPVSTENAATLSVALAKSCLSATLLYLLGKDSRDVTTKEEGVESSDGYISRLQSILIGEERRLYLCCISESLGMTRPEQHHASMTPTWTKSSWSFQSNKAKELSHPETVDPASLSRLKSNLCDVLIELCLVSTDIESNDETISCRNNSLTTMVTTLMGLKGNNTGVEIIIGQPRQLQDKKNSNNQIQVGAGFANHLPIGTVAPFFRLAALQLSNFLPSVDEYLPNKKRQMVEELDKVILSVVQYCDLLSSVYKGNVGKKTHENTPTQPATLQCFDAHDSRLRFIQFDEVVSGLWDLYESLGGEDTIRSFINYMETCCLNNKRVSRHTQQKDSIRFSLQSISSQSDIDVWVRHWRLSLVSTFATCITLLAKRDDVPSYQPTPTVSVDFWINIIDTLCTDLWKGLFGRSSGITPALYASYLQAIEVAIEYLLCKDDQELVFGNDLLESCEHKCQNASLLIRDIACRYALKQASLFKRTLLLSLHHLPSLLRNIERVHSRRPEIDVNVKILPIQHNLVDMTISQCLNMVQRDEISTQGIENIEGSQGEVGGDSTNDMETQAILEEDGESLVNNASITGSPTQDPDDPLRASSESTKRSLLLTSPDAWSWACACSIIAMERVWMEPYQIIQLQSNSGNVADTSRPSSPNCRLVNYAKIQVTQLSSTMRQIRQLLEEIPNDGKKSKQKEMYAQVLSSSSKMRLCSCLSRVTTTLKNAIRYVTKTIKECDIILPEEQIVNEGLLEALICLSSWLRPNEHVTLSKRSVDFTAGARRWYDAEKVHYSNVKRKAKQSRHIPVDPVLTRLPKVLLRIEELEASVQKLKALLFDVQTTKKGKVASSCIDSFLTLMLYDDSLSQKGGENSDGSPNKTNGNIQLYRLVSDYISSTGLDSSANDDGFGMAMILDEMDSDDDGDDDGGSSQKDAANGATRGVRTKRKSRSISVPRSQGLQKRLRDARRKVLRSRNEVVDTWLGLDEETAGEGKGTNDAYVDLEDFLVEG